jgi:hypothetical protein
MSYTVIAEIDGAPEATVTVTPRDAVLLVREYVKRGNAEVTVELAGGAAMRPAEFEAYLAKQPAAFLGQPH